MVFWRHEFVLVALVVIGVQMAGPGATSITAAEEVPTAANKNRRSSTKSSWCAVDVVQFDEAAKSATKFGAFKQKWTSVLQKIRISNKKKTAGAQLVKLPPDTIAESSWIRGIPNETKKPPVKAKDIKSWHFDLLQYSSEDLVPAFSQTLLHYDLLSKYNLDVDTVDNFARAVMERHVSVAYHNWHHGIAALHMSFCMLTLGGADEILMDDEIFALLFGALFHDVGHPGNNNQFEVARETPLAKKYDNKAVLEANSVDIVYNEILEMDGCDIFQGLKKAGRDEERLRVLDLAKQFVIATDAADHGSMLEELAEIRDAVDKSNAAHRSLLSRAIIHTADISNPAAPSFVVARDWCLRISKEFHFQVQEERRLGLPVSAFMDGLDDEYKIAKQQIGFYKFMALPLFETMGAVLPKVAVLEKWALQNVAQFEAIVKIVEKWKDEQMTEAGDVASS